MLRRRWLFCILVQKEIWWCSKAVLSGQFEVLMVASLSPGKLGSFVDV